MLVCFRICMYVRMHISIDSIPSNINNNNNNNSYTNKNNNTLKKSHPHRNSCTATIHQMNVKCNGNRSKFYVLFLRQCASIYVMCICMDERRNKKKGSPTLPVCLPAPAFLLASRLCLLLWLAIVEHIWNMCNCFARIQPTSHSLTRQNPDNITVRVHAYLFFYVCFETQQTTANDLTLHLCRRYKAYTKTFEMGNRVDGLTSWLTGRQAGKHTLTNISQNKQIISHLSCRKRCTNSFATLSICAQHVFV